MLDLKAKLLQAGLVTEDQVKAVEDKEQKRRDKARARKKGKGKKGGKGPPLSGEEAEKKRWEKRVQKLAEAGKAEQYEAIRGWVERTRLDKATGLPSEDAERFHFDKGEEGTISWLTVEPDLAAKLKAGEAGIIAFMGFNGRAFCAVPRDVALDVQKIRPDWLRHLGGHEFELLPLEPTGKKKKKQAEAAESEEKADGEAAAEPNAGSATDRDVVEHDAG